MVERCAVAQARNEVRHQHLLVHGHFAWECREHLAIGDSCVRLNVSCRCRRQLGIQTCHSHWRLLPITIRLKEPLEHARRQIGGPERAGDGLMRGARREELASDEVANGKGAEIYDVGFGDVRDRHRSTHRLLVLTSGPQDLGRHHTIDEPVLVRVCPGKGGVETFEVAVRNDLRQQEHGEHVTQILRLSVFWTLGTADTGHQRNLRLEPGMLQRSGSRRSQVSRLQEPSREVPGFMTSLSPTVIGRHKVLQPIVRRRFGGRLPRCRAYQEHVRKSTNTVHISCLGRVDRTSEHLGSVIHRGVLLSYLVVWVQDRSKPHFAHPYRRVWKLG
mmetsp:Transcript_58633/g.156106  ORF Transcript_58633/g.156106 Transcript_58633/m.156106 type:complete len:331 (+) Transcript_58633:481-1473(+)